MRPQLALATGSAATTTRIVSGPSTKIAMLRLLAQRTLTAGTIAWAAIKHAARGLTKAPGWVAQAALTVLSTPSGYGTVVGLASTGIRITVKGIDTVIRGLGRVTATLTGAIAGTAPALHASWGQAIVEAHADTIDAINRRYSGLQASITAFGQRLDYLARTPLVRTWATRGAATASGLLIVHALTRGLLAIKILAAAPALAGVIAAATSPWWLLLGIGITAVGALAWMAFITRGTTLDPGAVEELRVTVAADGTVIVTGIPADLGDAEQDQVAQEAAQAAIRQLERDTQVPKPAPRTSSPRATKGPRRTA